MKKRNKKNEDGLMKSIMLEARDSILMEIIWNILMFIPRMLIRFLKNIF